MPILQDSAGLSDSQPTEPKTTLAEQLKRLRLAKGHATARGFAKALGISENRYSRYERGEAVPKLELIWAICDVLKITPNELYGWGGEEFELRRAGGREQGHVGFAEAQPSTQVLDGASIIGSATSGGRGGSTGSDLAAWRLASLFASLGPAAATEPAAGNESARKLASIRAAAENFVQLRRDPFEALARLLQAPHVSGLDPAIEARLSSEIEAFLAALGSSSASS
jgi:transcriptional regulator with XRE-family HTH domain